MTRSEILAVAKPILFNTEMTRAIMNGRKTQTRRVIKPQPKGNTALLSECAGAYCFEDDTVARTKYKVGDYLYVRETWAAWSPTYGTAPSLYYKADDRCPKGIKWRPSIHMPKDAARTFLQITGVKAERLQGIDNDGAKLEGCDGRSYGPQDGATSDWIKEYDFGVEKFTTVWDSTIKPADMSIYGWDANPWVWVYTFKTVKEESNNVT